MQADLGVGVDDPEAVGPHDAHAVAPGKAHEVALGDGTLGPGLAEPGRDDDEALHPGPGALEHGVRNEGGRHRDHGLVDGARGVEDASHRGHARHPVGRGVDRVDGAGEAGREQVHHDLVPDAARRSPRADHGDGLRRQQAGHGTGLGQVAAGLDRGQRLGGGLDVEHDLDDAVAELAGGAKAGLAEHPQHLAVGGQHLGAEAVIAHMAGRLGQELEEHGADAQALVVIVDHEGDLGLVPPRPAVVAGDGDQVVAEHRDEGHAVLVVDVGEAVEVALAQGGARREVAEVDALGRLTAVEGPQPLAVVRADGSNVGGRAVGEDDIGLPVLRVGDRVRHRPHARGTRRHPTADGGWTRPLDVGA